MAGGAIEAKLATVTRNLNAILEHGNGTRARIVELEQHVEELKGAVQTQASAMAEMRTDLVILRAQALGGGPT